MFKFFRPSASVTPRVNRDGVTYIQEIEDLVKYVNEHTSYVNSVVENIPEVISATVTEQMDTLVEQTQTLQAEIDELKTNLDQYVNAVLLDPSSESHLTVIAIAQQAANDAVGP